MAVDFPQDHSCAAFVVEFVKGNFFQLSFRVVLLVRAAPAMQYSRARLLQSKAVSIPAWLCNQVGYLLNYLRMC